MISTTPIRTSNAYNSCNGGVNTCVIADTTGFPFISATEFATLRSCATETNSR